MIPVITLELDVTAITSYPQDIVETALVRAINRTTDRLRTKVARRTREQVAFPASYLSPAAKRLWVSQRAKAGAVEAVLQGQSRPTSLARFATSKFVPRNARKPGKPVPPVQVMVAPGQRKTIKRGFLIKLKNDNIGLAVRTQGGAPPGAWKPKEIAKNLWLLYGPSVDQTLIAASTGGGTFEDLQVESLEELEAEFLRQLEVLNGK